MHIIPATQEEEAGGAQFKASLGKKSVSPCVINNKKNPKVLEWLK
jgi:hypothetical protein